MTRWLAAARSLLYGTLFLALWGWLALEARALDPVLGVPLPGWTRSVGGILMAAGGLAAGLCAGAFVVEGRGTPAPFDPPEEFVAVGPYRWVRNPMYLGGVALLLGFGLWHRSVAMAAVGGVFFLLAHLFVRFHEEPHLEERFGDRYRSYRRRVNRWLPTPPESSH